MNKKKKNIIFQKKKVTFQVRRSTSIIGCVRWLVGWLGTHSFDDPHVAPYWPTWPCVSYLSDRREVKSYFEIQICVCCPRRASCLGHRKFQQTGMIVEKKVVAVYFFDFSSYFLHGGSLSLFTLSCLILF